MVLAGLLAGLLGSLHCVAMCGGIATGIATGFRHGTALVAALRLNLGRVLGYTLAGALAGGLGSQLVALARWEGLQRGLRLAAGAVIVLAALRVLFPRLRFGVGGSWIWQRLQPLSAGLIPANTGLRQLLLGALWGWLPCGLSATLLTSAWLSADALQGALVMLAFGAGTLLTMVPLSFSGQQLTAWLRRGAWRHTLGLFLLLAGLSTLGAPWLARVPALHALLSALGCRTLP